MKNGKKVLRIAIVLVDGFNLQELSQVLSLFRHANRVFGAQKFDVTILTLDDRFALSSWNVSVVPSGALCSAGEQDIVFVAADERPHETLIQNDWRSKRSSFAAKPSFTSLTGPLEAIRAITSVDDGLTVGAKRRHPLSVRAAKAAIGRYCHGDDTSDIASAALHSGSTDFDPLVSERRPARLNAAIRLMAENLEDPLSLRDIVERLGCSSRQLSRWFNAHLSTTPLQYYATLRLARAKHMLLHSNLSITEISVACGYQWVAQFSKAYRK